MNFRLLSLIKRVTQFCEIKKLLKSGHLVDIEGKGNNIKIYARIIHLSIFSKRQNFFSSIYEVIIFYCRTILEELSFDIYSCLSILKFSSLIKISEIK
jgi:hypothetical protein